MGSTQDWPPGGAAAVEEKVRHSPELCANLPCAADCGARNLLVKRTTDPDSIKGQPFKVGASRVMAPVGNCYLLKALTRATVFNGWVLPTTMRAEAQQQAFLRIAG